MQTDIKREFRPLVYICSPYSGDVEHNTERTRQFCRYALEHGQIPLSASLLFPQFMDDDKPEERELAMFMDIVLMGKCQGMLFPRVGELRSTGLRNAVRKSAILTASLRRWSSYE